MAEQGATYFREVFPVRRWIRRHYTKIPGRRTANCKHCPDLVPIRPSIMLHDHLVKAHSNELTEDEKKDKLTYWVWDHFTIKDTQYATCNICGSELKSTIRNLHQHLKFVHGILPPCTDDMDNVRRNTANCNHCPKQIAIQPMIFLFNHLVQEHSNELTEGEKEDKLLHWLWDYFTLQDTRYARCNICGKNLKCNRIDYLRRHLKHMHG
ncbi:hypothetical protein ALC57_12823 [Trachymyrmex cornetzi]|uniref:BED-type domain-containing protein n=1 Tax=Trachymyrmex cornetzi TaxID=471704 RepID=A0A151J0I1_9HYME|nr:hypothetical protein ALC57_12823 [Trachymyrmex cornetzi]